MNCIRLSFKQAILATAASAALIAPALTLMPHTAQANEQERKLGESFRSAFPFSRLNKQWWIAEYDHPAGWFHTAWRKTSVAVDPTGLKMHLTRTSDENLVEASAKETDEENSEDDKAKTSKSFTSGQVQRVGWYGYGRYEVIMQPSAGDGLVSAFYVYTGAHFGDTHEEIDIEFLGRNTNKIHLNRFRDGNSMAKPVWADLDYDASETPRLYAFEWSKDSIVWYAGDKEVFRLTGEEEIPKPPAKIYLDLWAVGPGQAAWAGSTEDIVAAEALFQCVSYRSLFSGTDQCSDLLGTQ